MHKSTWKLDIFQITHFEKGAHKKQKEQLPGTSTNRITLYALIVSQTHSSRTPQSIQDSARLRVTFHRPTAKLHYLLNCHFTRTHAAFIVAPVIGGHIKAINKHNPTSLFFGTRVFAGTDHATFPAFVTILEHSSTHFAPDRAPNVVFDAVFFTATSQ